MRYPPIRYAGPMEAAQAFAAGALRSMPNAQILDRGAAVIVRAEIGGRVSVAAFTGKGAKPAAYYGFPQAARADAWIEEFAAGAQLSAANKAARVQVKKMQTAAFVMPYQVGDVLYGSWGYDQTNVEFYEVVAIYGKRAVGIRALAQVCRADSGISSMAEYVMPATGPDRFYDPESDRAYVREKAQVLRKIVGNEGSINLNGHCYLSKFDGRERYQSHYA